jgi:hypothetical protein
MRANLFFLQHLTQEQFFRHFSSNPDAQLPIPSHLCAHPTPTCLRHIKECEIIDFVRPYGEQLNSLICICLPTIIDPPVYSLNPLDLFEEIHSCWNEYLYLPLDQIEICPHNEEEQDNRCQFRRTHRLQ